MPFDMSGDGGGGGGGCYLCGGYGVVPKDVPILHGSGLDSAALRIAEHCPVCTPDGIDQGCWRCCGYGIVSFIAERLHCTETSNSVLILAHLSCASSEARPWRALLQ